MAKFKWVDSLKNTPTKLATKEMAMQLNRCVHFFTIDKYPKGTQILDREIGFIGVFIDDALLPCIRIIIAND